MQPVHLGHVPFTLCKLLTDCKTPAFWPVWQAREFSIYRRPIPQILSALAGRITITLGGLLGRERGQRMDRLGLAPCGVYPAAFVAKRAVRSYRTFSPLPLRAVYFLWHFPSDKISYPSALSGGALPYGVRKFLPCFCKQERLSGRLFILYQIRNCRINRADAGVAFWLFFLRALRV